MGKDGFTWFVGVVEDRNDPKKLGRLRVRCLGYHAKELNKLPKLIYRESCDEPNHKCNSIRLTTPLNKNSRPTSPNFFIDNPDAQQPMIIEHTTNVPKDLPVKDAVNVQDYINANYPKYKESDVNRLTRNDDDSPHITLTLRMIVPCRISN